MRTTIVMIALMLMTPTARAESIGVWSYAAPQGFEVSKKPTQHEYTRVEGKTFCLLGVYVPRPAGAALADDLKQEWTKLVEATFRASGVTTSPTKQTKQGLTKHTSSAKLANETGSFYGQVVVIRDRSTVGSVMLVSNTAQTIKTCQPALTALTDSIAFTRTETTAPVAAKGSLVAQWGIETALRQHNNDNWMVGYVKLQYDLHGDATYVFRKEIKFEASPKTTFDSYLESGTYTVDGAKLTITPKSSKHVKRDIDGKVLMSDNVALEKVTYRWKLEPVDQETLLLIDAGKATLRDGTPNGGDYFPGGYILSNRKKLDWKY